MTTGKRARVDIFGKWTRQAVRTSSEGFGGDGRLTHSDEAGSDTGAVGDTNSDADDGIDLDAVLVSHIDLLSVLWRFRLMFYKRGLTEMTSLFDFSHHRLKVKPAKKRRIRIL